MGYLPFGKVGILVSGSKIQNVLFCLGSQSHSTEKMCDDLGWTPSPGVLEIKKRMLKKGKGAAAAPSAAPSAPSRAELAPLVELYEKHGGNMMVIFATLGE